MNPQEIRGDKMFVEAGWLDQEFQRVHAEVENGSELVRQGAREALEFVKQKNREHAEPVDLTEGSP